MPTPSTTLYLNTVWRDFRAPYYDPNDELVYYTVETNWTKIDSNKNWDAVMKENREHAVKYFNDNGLFIFPVEVAPITQPALPKEPKDTGENCKSNTVPPKQTTGKSDQSIFVGFKYDLSPRPDATIKILYHTKASNVNVDKVRALFEKEEEAKNKPNYGQELFEDWKGYTTPSGADLEINNIGDFFTKMQNIENLADVNAFLTTTVESSEQLRMKYIAGPLNARPGDLKTQLENSMVGGIKQAVNILDLPLAGEVYNETLKSTEFLADYFIYSQIPIGADISRAIDNFQDPLGVPAGYTNVSPLAESYKKMTSTLQPLLKYINQFGMVGLLECLVALMIEQISAQGYIALAALLTRELDRLGKHFLAFSAEYKQYAKLWELAKQRSKQGQSPDWDKIIGEAIETALLEAGKELVKLGLGACLKSLASDKAGNDFNFGGLARAQVYDDPNLPLEVFKDKGWSTDDLDDAAKKQVLDFIEKVFVNFTPREICRLLEGFAEPALIGDLEALLAKFKDASKLFESDPPSVRFPKSSQQKIADFFRSLGLSTGTTICDKINKEADKNTQIVDYCGTKVPMAYKAAMQEKLTEDQVKAILSKNDPQKSIAALGKIFSDNFVEDLIPKFDWLLLLKPSYTEAQDRLRQYQAQFLTDLSLAFDSPAVKANKIPKVTGTKDAIGELGWDSPKGFAPDLNAKLAKLMGISIPANYYFETPVFGGNFIEPIKYSPSPFPSFILAKLPDPKSPALTFKINKGNYYVDRSPAYSHFPASGKSSQNGEFPLFILGKNLLAPSTLSVGKGYIPADYNIKADPTDKIIDVIHRDDNSGMIYPVYIKDFYADVIFRLVFDRVNAVSAVVTKINKNPLKYLNFYKKQRIERIEKTLCAARTSDPLAEPYITDGERATKVECLRILILSLIIENYPRLYAMTIVNPEMYLTKIELDKHVPGLVNLFGETVGDFGVTLPVKNLMCEMNLSVEGLIKDELEFLTEAVKADNSLVKLQDIEVQVKSMLKVATSPLETLLGDCFQHNPDDSEGEDYTIFINKGLLGKFIANYRGTKWRHQQFEKVEHIEIDSYGNPIVHIQMIDHSQKIETNNFEGTIDVIFKGVKYASKGYGAATKSGFVNPLDYIPGADPDSAEKLDIDLIYDFLLSGIEQWKFGTFDGFLDFYFGLYIVVMYMAVIQKPTAPGTQGDNDWDKITSMFFQDDSEFDVMYQMKYFNKLLGIEDFITPPPIKILEIKQGDKTVPAAADVNRIAAINGAPSSLWSPQKPTITPAQLYRRPASGLDNQDLLVINKFIESIAIDTFNPLKKQQKSLIDVLAIAASTTPPPLNADLPLAFSPALIEEIAAYYLTKYINTQGVRPELFKTLKSSVCSIFSGGVSVASTQDQLKTSFAAYENARDLEIDDPSMWWLIIMLIPKVIFEAVKAIALAAVYSQNPLAFALIQLAFALGYNPTGDDFYDMLTEKQKKAINATSPVKLPVKAVNKELTAQKCDDLKGGNTT